MLDTPKTIQSNTHTAADWRSNKYFVLGILGLVNLFNYMDRNLFAVLLEPIKQDMQFTDAQLGILGGFSFALCYAIFGLILGRLADRNNRIALLSASLAVWSMASAACGLARNFAELFLARVGVGVGEAGCVPAAHSLIGDFFPARERAFAIAVFTGVGGIGSVIAVALGGTLADLYGWQAVFLIFGLPGIVLALLLRFLINEPARGQFELEQWNTRLSFLAAAKSILQKRTARWLLLAIPLYYFMIGGASLWIPSFYVRVHEVSIGEFGRSGGLAMGLGSLLGTFFGGALATRLIDRNRLWEFWLPSLAALLSIGFYFGAFSAANLALSYGFLCVASIIVGSGIGASMSSLHVVTAANVRAIAVGFMLLSTSLIAYGAGPLLVGAGSDVLLYSGWSSNDGDSLALSLKISLVLPLLASLLFWLASRSALKEAVN